MAAQTADPVASLISEAASKIESARAKINLALHVLDRRPDGYHNLDSLVVFAELADTVTALPSSLGDIFLSVDGPFAEVLEDVTGPQDNLVMRIALGLADAFPEAARNGMHLRLEKHLPVAAGIGGGSADAAATLRLLNRTWRLGLEPDQLAKLGLAAGADVPACVRSRPSRMRGIGEDLKPAPEMPPLPLLLINPGIAISTQEVFRAIPLGIDRDPLPPLPAQFRSVMECVFWLRNTRNDLFGPAATVAPPVRMAVQALATDSDCMFARMSGSGATVFGIFMSMDAAQRAANRIQATEPSWWVQATTTGTSG